MTRCLSCLANATNLSLIPVIQMQQRHQASKAVWEMSTYGATLAYLERNFPQVYASEYFPHASSGAEVNGVLCQDVQRLSFENASLDLITSNQVFEHVPDDIQGYRECYRVLRPQGALIFSVPLYDMPVTQQLAAIRNGKIEYLTPPEYHDSRHGGVGSALCYWRHAFHDIAQRVASVGFSVRLVEVRLPVQLPESTYVVHAVKS